jgi:hypothetical protein
MTAARAARPAPAPPAPETTRARHTVHAERLLQSLYNHTNQLKAQAPPGAGSELIANQSIAFLTGWVDALRFTSAEVLDALGESVRGRLCAGDLDAEQTLVSVYVLQWMPELSTPEVFDCFLRDPRRKDVEDIEVWAMLDAWRASGLEPPAAVAALKSHAHDPRTLRRFDRDGGRGPGAIAQAAPRAGGPPLDSVAR